MTTTIEHVRHRVTPESVLATMRHYDAPPLMLTVCGRRFIGIRESTRDTRHHEPATSRCPECWRPRQMPVEVVLPASGVAHPWSWR